MDKVTRILLKQHLRAANEIVYTGKTTDSNSLLHLKPLYVTFVLANLPYFREAYGYQLRRGRTEPGQKAHIWAHFRDDWLPQVLRELRAEDEGKPLDEIPETQYKYKRNQTISFKGQPTTMPCVQAVIGWQWRKDVERDDDELGDAEGDDNCDAGSTASTDDPKSPASTTDVAGSSSTDSTVEDAASDAPRAYNKRKRDDDEWVAGEWVAADWEEMIDSL